MLILALLFILLAFALGAWVGIRYPDRVRAAFLALCAFLAAAWAYLGAAADKIMGG